jgi:hypothetical protein
LQLLRLLPGYHSWQIEINSCLIFYVHSIKRTILCVNEILELWTDARIAVT